MLSIEYTYENPSEYKITIMAMAGGSAGPFRKYIRTATKITGAIGAMRTANPRRVFRSPTQKKKTTIYRANMTPIIVIEN